MLYHEYQNKMQRVGALLQKLWRFRVLIACLFVAALVFVITMSSMAGVVSDATECPAEIVYGEEIPYRASAVFQGVRYEYRPDGGEWTEEVPRLVGSYWVRALSKGAGKKGKEHFFRIVPREVSVGAAREWVYGEEPEPTASLLQGESVTCTQFSYRFPEAYGKGEIDSAPCKAFITPVLEAVRIFGENGEDITFCYSITARESEVNAAPRTLTIRVKDAEKVYDGTPLTCSEYELEEGTLASGDELVLGFPASIVDAGSMKNTPTVGVFHGQEERTGYYRFEIAAGELTVGRRPISVDLGTVEKEYDGTPLRVSGREIGADEIEELAAGHRVVLDGADEITLVGEKEITLTASVLDGDGKDVSSNYVISLSAGKLSVLPRPIVVTSKDIEAVYDGEEHAAREEDCILRYAGSDPAQTSALAEGDEWRLFMVSSCRDVMREGDEILSMRNEIVIDIYNAQGPSDLSQRLFCYNIVYEFGTLTILPRPVTVRSLSRQWEYDGKAHGGEEQDIELIDGTLAPEGAYLRLSPEAFVTNVWETPAENHFTAFVLDLKGNDLTPNYDISYEYGTLTVTPRPLYVSVMPRSWIYDGTEHTPSPEEDAEDFFVDADALVAGQRAICTTDPSAKIKDVNQTPVQRTFTVLIIDGAGVDVTRNYAIEKKYDVLRIKPRPVRIVTGSAEFCYDGEIHTCSDYLLAPQSPYDLVQGHTLTITKSTEIRDVYYAYDEVASLENRLVEYTVTDEAGESVKENYDVRCSAYGSLLMTPRPVTVQTQSGTAVYDGTRKEFPELLPAGGLGLVKEHRLVFGESVPSAPYDRIDVGEWENAVKALIEDPALPEGERDVTGNYELSYLNGTVEITPRSLVLRSRDIQLLYNGKLQRGDGKGDPVGNGPAKGDEVNYVASVTGGRTDVGVAEHLFEAYLTNASRGGEDVTRNYSIRYSYGKLEILPRPITVRTASTAFPYDGKPHSDGSCEEVGEYGLAEGHTLKALGAFPTVTALYESKSNQFGAAVYADSEEVTRNYALSYEYGTISIVRRKIEVETPSARFEYDGKPHSATSGSRVVSGIGLLSGHRLVVSGSPLSRTDVGITKNVLTFRVLGSGSRDVTDYYEIDVLAHAGNLEIYPRAITVRTESGEHVYDGTRPEFKKLELVDKRLVSGHSIFYAGPDLEKIKGYEGVDVGRWQNLVRVQIRDGQGTDKTANYEISYEYGTLTITPRPITLTSSDVSAVYDGQPHQGSGKDVTVTDGTLVDGDSLVLSFLSHTDVCREENRFTAKIENTSRGEVTDNYEIAYGFGTFEITRRFVHIIITNKDFFFDGNEHGSTEFTVGEDGYPLVEGHTYTVPIYLKRSYVSRFTNMFYLSMFDEQGRDVTDNYQFLYTPGWVRIRYKIVIALFDVSKVYDGTPLTYLPHDWYYVENFANLSVYFILEGSLTKPGSLSMEDIKALPIEVYTSGFHGLLDEDEYVVFFEEGPTLTVLKRSITIATESVSRRDDGTPLTAEGWTLAFGSLAEGDRLEVTVTGKQEGVGSSANTFEYRIYDRDGNDVTDCYEVECRTGTLELTG